VKNTDRAVGAGEAEDATASPRKFFWVKFIRFRQFWLDLGKIEAKFGKIEAKLWQN